MAVICTSVLCLIPACRRSLPSHRINAALNLPVPRSLQAANRLGDGPDMGLDPRLRERGKQDHADDAAREGEDGSGRHDPEEDASRGGAASETAEYIINPRRLVTLTFDLHPEIKSSYNRFKSEEGRYDFFVVSRDSLTPRLSIGSDSAESREGRDVTRTRGHDVSLGVEKRFFDTTAIDAAVGWAVDAEDGVAGDHPVASASLRYPLWASRERLERASEEIFRRNQMNDAKLAYIQQVRNQVANALYRYQDLTQQMRSLEFYRSWRADLESIVQVVDGVPGRDTSKDMERAQAELTRVAAEVTVYEGWVDVHVARTKLAAGIPFDAELVVRDKPFNPFVGATLEALRAVALDTDPEIRTLRNAMENARAQLDLAKQGRWDVALLLDGSTSLEGEGDDDGMSGWSASVGLEVGAVDPRVTDSLIKQSQSNIRRFRFAISQRINRIYVDTVEPLIRLDTIGRSLEELRSNLPEFYTAYEKGIAQYRAGTLNIDDLLKRREDYFNRQESINSKTWLIGANVTQLCSATGKFFELLETHIAAGEQDAAESGESKKGVAERHPRSEASLSPAKQPPANQS